MPIRQQALHVTCPDGGHDLETIDATHYVGPVEYGWSVRNDNDPTVLGVGPLAGTWVPGASGLVLACRSPLWDGFYCSSLPGGGLTLAALGQVSLVVLRGRAPRPSVLFISEEESGSLEVRIEPVDPEPLWQGTHDGEGVIALLHHLAHHQRQASPNLQVIAVGPAAAHTRFGSLCVGRWEEGDPVPVRGWMRRGGLGSRLFQAHSLCGVVLSARSTSGELAEELHEGNLLGGFHAGMSVEELAELVRYEFSPRLLDWGETGATLSALRQRLLLFNGSSVYRSSQERDELYHRAVRDHYLKRLVESTASADVHHSCGEACPIACKTLVGGRLREPEPYLALGPQLGVLDPGAADGVVGHCDTLGLDSLSAGAAVAWLLERLERHLLEPGFLDLGGQPRWASADFDPLEDSRHNARIARRLADGVVFAPWAEALRRGLRDGAREAGGQAASLAVYNSNGESGEASVLPCWAPGYYTPMPISGEYHQYHGTEFVPPRVLGRKSAQRMIGELMLQNFGFCRLHRGWAEELAPDLINRQLRTNTDWPAQHRDLAKRIFRRRKARFWETARVIDIISTYLQDYQHEAAPDVELDRWVRRFREDRASAARAYWSEVNAGMEEILGS